MGGVGGRSRYEGATAGLQRQPGGTYVQKDTGYVGFVCVAFGGLRFEFSSGCRVFVQKGSRLICTVRV